MRLIDNRVGRYRPVEQKAGSCITPAKCLGIREAFVKDPTLTYAQLALRFRVSSRQARTAIRDIRNPSLKPPRAAK